MGVGGDLVVCLCLSLSENLRNSGPKCWFGSGYTEPLKRSSLLIWHIHGKETFIQYAHCITSWRVKWGFVKYPDHSPLLKERFGLRLIDSCGVQCSGWCAGSVYYACSLPSWRLFIHRSQMWIVKCVITSTMHETMKEEWVRNVFKISPRENSLQ